MNRTEVHRIHGEIWPIRRSVTCLCWGDDCFFMRILEKVQNKNFTIHVWKHWDRLFKRHLQRYTDQTFDPFEGCSVNNCNFTWNDEDVLKADAVLFHLHQTKHPPNQVPRRPNQIWVWTSDESPRAIFQKDGGDSDITHYSGFFNWSMTYRIDSDVPVPYGRTIPLLKGEEPQLIDLPTRKKDIVLLSSHCSGENGRFNFVDELWRHLKFDIFGKCGKSEPCPGHYKKNCDVINDYKIYLAFENNNCDDYLTEKVIT